MSEWVVSKLQDYIKVEHGFAFEGQYFTDTPNDNVLVTPGNFRIGGGFKADKEKYYSGPIPEEYILSCDDLIVTMTDLSKQADTLGFPALVPGDDGRTYLHNQRIGKVIFLDKRLNKHFLYYLLCSRDYRNEILASATGTSIKHTAPRRIENFSFSCPSLLEQQDIASVLKCLDDKIELNQRMNETLEAMARALFKSWFVDFDPVRARAEGRKPEGMDAATAALFPAAFNDDGLPEGWARGTLGKIADSAGVTVQPNQASPDTPYIGLEHMPRRCIALSEWEGAGKVTSNKFAFKRGDFLFGKLRPYFHKVGIAVIDGISSTDILIVRPKQEVFYAFVLSVISSDEFVSHTDQTSRGTKMPRTNWKDMSAYAVTLPENRVVAAYNLAIKPMLEKIIANVHENRTLSSLRDALLPKLISGELRIADAEERIREAV